MHSTSSTTFAREAAARRTASLDLAVVGNGAIGMLIDATGKVVWGCIPRFDGDPVFCSLLQGEGSEASFAVELTGMVRGEQNYIPDTPVLVTRLFDERGGAIEITDFAPRFENGGELFTPVLLVRQVRPLAGEPVIRIRLTAAAQYGCVVRTPALESGYIRYPGEPVLRLAGNGPLESIARGDSFSLGETMTLAFGASDSVEALGANVSSLLQRTTEYWRHWVGSLRAAGEWREAVVRAAITLKLNVYERTGAIIAAMTTSIPEAPDTGRNWDYRYCWPRDAYFVANALARLGDLRTTERYLAFVLDRANATSEARLKPIYAVDGGTIPDEHEAKCLSGYRDMGPVRIGNAAHEQLQHDIYGEAVLTAAPLFTLTSPSWAGDEALLLRLEPLGENAARLYDQPDAGLWELRGTTRVHTFSSIMCWAACDRLAKYAAHLELADRAERWKSRAAEIHAEILRRSWNPHLNAFTASMEGDSLDASLLLIPKLGFLPANDPRFAGTVAAIERDLKHGDFIYRYIERDDFGRPENAFLVCTFWYIDALARMGRRDEARGLFEKVLSARNRHGLLAEDLDPNTHEQWGNFVQTYSMAGIIDSAAVLAESSATENGQAAR